VVSAWRPRPATLESNERAQCEQSDGAITLRAVRLQRIGDLVVVVKPAADEPDADQVTQVEVPERHGIGIAQRAAPDLGGRPDPHARDGSQRPVCGCAVVDS